MAHIYIYMCVCVCVFARVCEVGHHCQTITWNDNPFNEFKLQNTTFLPKKFHLKLCSSIDEACINIRNPAALYQSDPQIWIINYVRQNNHC